MLHASDLLKTLIRYNTTDVDGDEALLVHFLYQHLQNYQPDILFKEAVPGCNKAYVFAQFGNPQVLLNVHIDTVPVNSGWQSDPFEALEQDQKIFGLGAADTKGAIAAILAAFSVVAPKNVAVLFSGDEENQGRCLRHFLEHHRLECNKAIVCEPTGCTIGIRHRGILCVQIHVAGKGGHSSYADNLPAPLVDLSRVALALDAWGQKQRTLGPKDFLGMCLNIARFKGGVAFNVVPQEAMLEISVRPPPLSNNQDVLAELEQSILQNCPHAVIRCALNFPSFATRDVEPFQHWLKANTCNLEFWTEAALLAQKNIDAVVYGPGHIAQAHAPNEWVSLEQLEHATQTFVGILHATR